MAIKSKFFDRTFRDTTLKRNDIVQIVTSSGPENVIVKVYERKDTLIIHSKSDQSSHASISKGNGHIKEWEIAYVVQNILKEDNENVYMYIGRKGVIHIRTKR